MKDSTRCIVGIGTGIGVAVSMYMLMKITRPIKIKIGTIYKDYWGGGKFLPISILDKTYFFDLDKDGMAVLINNKFGLIATKNPTMESKEIIEIKLTNEKSNKVIDFKRVTLP